MVLILLNNFVYFCQIHETTYFWFPEQSTRDSEDILNYCFRNKLLILPI